ncbi:MAG TPA: phosphoribosyl-AMP cyclohydrolase [Caldilineaceae bacterium]|nr:phosphoribosyl-AMP cyclohydrolase [Caldilineaceae bacterium]
MEGIEWRVSPAGPTPVEALGREEFLALVQYDANGLVPAIVQDAGTREVLMMAWMNAESLAETLATGEMVFWSRSRKALWHKGATSGNTQRVVELRIDCDGDTLLALVEPAGPACHTGAVACFFRALAPTH